MEIPAGYLWGVHDAAAAAVEVDVEKLGLAEDPYEKGTQLETGAPQKLRTHSEGHNILVDRLDTQIGEGRGSLVVERQKAKVVQIEELLHTFEHPNRSLQVRSSEPLETWERLDVGDEPRVQPNYSWSSCRR